MTHSITITPILAMDMADMERLYKASVAANPDGFIQDLDYHGSIIQFAERVLAAGGAFAVAKVEGEIVGMVALNPSPANATQATLCKLHVYKAQQGLGVGRKLAEYILEQAYILGFVDVVLDVVTSQKAAIGLYTKLGFEEERVEMWHGAFKGQPLAFEVMYMVKSLEPVEMLKRA